MKDEERIEKYLSDVEMQFHKMMRAYFKTKSYMSKLEDLPLDDNQREKLDDLKRRFNKNIKRRMREAE